MEKYPVECAITTFDNPYNPFEQFTLWDLFDKEKGYYSNQKVARLVNFTSDMTEKEMTQKLGYAKIWDCGLYKYEWKKQPE